MKTRHLISAAVVSCAVGVGTVAAQGAAAVPDAIVQFGGPQPQPATGGRVM